MKLRFKRESWIAKWQITIPLNASDSEYHPASLLCYCPQFQTEHLTEFIYLFLVHQSDTFILENP